MTDDELKTPPHPAEVAQVEDLIDDLMAHDLDTCLSAVRRLVYQRDALLAENERLRGLLRKHEWSAVDFGAEPGDFWHCCPECGVSKEYDGRHEPGCAWAAALTS